MHHLRRVPCEHTPRIGMTGTSARTRLRWFGALGSALAGALCLGAGGSPLAAGDVALEYRAADGCPGEAVLRERSADLFEFRDPFVPAGTRASSTFRVQIEREGKGWRATLTHLDAGGNAVASTRERHDSCDGLVYLLAHDVKLAISRPPPAPAVPPPSPAPAIEPGLEKELLRRLDRLEETQEAQDEKIAALEQKDRAQRALIEKLKRELEDGKKMNLTYTLSTGVLLTANLTSNVGPGVWVAGDLRSGPLVLGLDLRAVLPSRVVVGPYDLDLSQFVGLVTPCGRYSVFFGCVVAGAGLQVGYDSNFDPRVPPARYAPLVQLGGRAGVEVPLGETRFAIRGWGEVLYTTPSWEFGYDNLEYVVQRPDVSAFFGLGFVVKLGNEGEK